MVLGGKRRRACRTRRTQCTRRTRRVRRRTRGLKFNRRRKRRKRRTKKRGGMSLDAQRNILVARNSAPFQVPPRDFY